jgi:hypothetical protein
VAELKEGRSDPNVGLFQQRDGENRDPGHIKDQSEQHQGGSEVGSKVKQSGDSGFGFGAVRAKASGELLG